MVSQCYVNVMQSHFIVLNCSYAQTMLQCYSSIESYSDEQKLLALKHPSLLIFATYYNISFSLINITEQKAARFVFWHITKHSFLYQECKHPDLNGAKEDALGIQ